MLKALLVIDYTVDFVTGSLPCGQPAIDLEASICQLTEQFVQQQDLVVMAVDLHHAGDTLHPEHRLFPPHNLQGTAGRALYGALDSVYNRHKEAIYWMDKTRYSAFVGTDLELQLRTRGIQEIHLVGVCTDICILHTAVDAYNKGFDIVVHESGVASFNEQGHQWALQHFTNTLGATVIKA